MRRIISVAFVGLVLAATAAAQAGKPVNTKCPVKTDIPAKADITSAYKGLVIGFCCQDCKGKFSGNPDVYAEKSPEIKAALAKSGGGAEQPAKTDGATPAPAAEKSDAAAPAPAPAPAPSTPPVAGAK